MSSLKIIREAVAKFQSNLDESRTSHGRKISKEKKPVEQKTDRTAHGRKIKEESSSAPNITYRVHDNQGLASVHSFKNDAIDRAKYIKREYERPTTVHMHDIKADKMTKVWSSDTNEETVEEGKIGPVKKGQMHKDLGQKPGTKETAADIAKEKAKGGVFAKRAIFAQNAKKWNHHKEETQLDELSKDTHTAYIKAASKSLENDSGVDPKISIKKSNQRLNYIHKSNSKVNPPKETLMRRIKSHFDFKRKG